jgi:hypothetical protein
MSLPFTPIVTMVSRLALVVRSGLMTAHESPRSFDTNTLFAATMSVPTSIGEMIIGVSQCQRYVSPLAGAGDTLLLAAAGRMLFDSPVTLLRRMMLPSCVSL